MTKEVDLDQLFTLLCAVSAAKMKRSGTGGEATQMALDTANMQMEYIELIAGAAISIAHSLQKIASKGGLA